MPSAWARPHSLESRARFLHCLYRISQRLEFQAQLGPAADLPPLAGDVRDLQRLLDDLRAECATDGRPGAEFYRDAAMVHDTLVAAAIAADAGDLSPWRAAGQDVAGRLVAMHSHVDHQQPAGEARLPAPQAPARAAVAESTTAPERAVVDAAHDAAQSSISAVITLSTDERKMLATLLENDATSPEDGSRLRKGDVIDFGRMKEHIVRKVATALTRQGLVASRDGRGGGYWLTDVGVGVARSIQSQKNT